MPPARQGDWFGLFAPTRGVHRAPPVGSLPPAPTPAIPMEIRIEVGATGAEAVAAPEGSGPELIFQQSLRARNYRLTLRRDGVAVATIPARGSQREAERFVARHRAWLDRARERQRRRPRAAEAWPVGASVLWRGALTELRLALAGARPQVSLGADLFRVPSLEGDLRPALEARFAHRARIELPARTWELAAATGVPVTRVGVRNQRSRWGSCTAAGVISLNWRLIQTPLREMNHSARFWARVEEVCPEWREAEAWIKRNGGLAGL